MTYDPNLLSRFDGILDGRWNYWVYRSADPFSTVKAPGYFGEVASRGVKARDLLIVLDTATPATTLANVMTVTATSCTISQGGVSVADAAGGGTGGGSGTVTSITVGPGLTATPDPVTIAGSLALTVPVSVANGGTGATSAPAALANLGGAPLASPVFTGDPQAPTPATADNDTSIATTAYVRAQGYGVGSLTGVTAGTGLTGGGTSGNPTIALTTPVSIANGGTGATTAPLALANLGGAPASGFPLSWTMGSVAFATSSTALGQDNANLFWDDANNRLGIGTAAPAQPLHVNGNVTLSGDLYVGGGTNPALQSSPPSSNWYTILHAPDGTGTGRGIHVGSTGAGAHNYYRNDDHHLQSADGSVDYLTATATAVTANLNLFAPTAAAATNTTQVATTAYVKAQGYQTGNQTITASGDATGSGTTTLPLTLATVNSNVGTFQGLTVNGKGQVTAAANQSYVTGGPYLPLTGGSLSGTLTVNAQISGTSTQSRSGNFGSWTGHGFNMDWTGAAALWVDGTNLGNIAFTSDYRIKKNVVALPSTWERVKALRPVSYTQAEYHPPVEPARSGDEPAMFPADDVERWGFIAHELQETLTQSAATGEKDQPDLVQSPNPWTVIATLTSALQEAMARIEALEAAV